MVFIKDAKREFLDQIINKRVLVFVHLDTDALCAWKILQHLLHCEHILYTVIPVHGKQELENAYSLHRQVTKNIIMINCGSNLDLIEFLQPPEDSIIYLIDSMRPFEVRNVYNGVQIKIIVLQNELGIEQKTVPEFDDIFAEDEEEVDEDDDEAEEGDELEDDEDEEEEVDDGFDGEEEADDDDEASKDSNQSNKKTKKKKKPDSKSKKKKKSKRAEDDEEEEEEEDDYDRASKKKSKRTRYDPEYLERLQSKREWEEKRTRILFEYYKYTYHRCSSSLVLFDLAWKTAKDNNDLLWWSIIGVTEQYINAKIDKELYARYTLELNSHVLRHNHRPANQASVLSINNGSNQGGGSSSSSTSADDVSINCLKISHVDDINMVLLRHWSILESIYHSIDLACLFKMWTNKGKKKLNEFLADLGLPISECKQKYAYMDSSLKGDFKLLVASESIREKYRYDESQIYLSTFIASFGYCNKLTGFDMAYAVDAILENNDEQKNMSDKFIEALNCLNRENLKTLDFGLDLARTHFKRIFQQIQNFIDANQIAASGPFLQVFLEEGSPDNAYFAQTFSSKRLARYALQSYLALTKGKKVRNLPLVICVPLTESTSLITGVPPYRSSNNTENCFGLAFDDAVERTKSRVNFDYFDTSTIEINNEDKSKFLDALVAVMQ